ncbi:MAG: DNA/RNA nuclease SfsA [Nitrospiraceae bacterium]|nr:DNA/RNA nuclease SfsA [Nitrospiraceae bacterium]
MKLFENIIPATFLSRPNRFVLRCDLGGRTVNAYLPNPGRLWELLFPGTTVYLTKFPPSSERKLKYLAVAVLRDGMPIMLHTHHTNDVAAHLIRQNRIPGLEGAEIVKAEHTIGGSRFDFLLRKDGRDILLEVKSCTLVSDGLAMFPDAISARATKHVEELAHLTGQGYGAAVLFVVGWPHARYFMPEHHTDLEFSRALYNVRDRVMVRAVAIGWEKDLSLRLERAITGDSGNTFSRRDAERADSCCPSNQNHPRSSNLIRVQNELPFARNLAVPWGLVDREAHDRGCYVIVLKLPRERKIAIGRLGEMRFRKGYYLYVGSAMKDLTKRIERHRRLIKKYHWHIDYLREQAEFIAAIPIRASVDLECLLAQSAAKCAGWSIPGFGSSDCSCESHLFGMTEDPVHQRQFIEMLLYYRMGRLEEELGNAGPPPDFLPVTKL